MRPGLLALVEVAAIALAGCGVVAIAKELPPQLEDPCAAAGGCAWVSRDWMMEKLKAAEDAGYEAGLKKGVADTTEKCRNFVGLRR